MPKSTPEGKVKEAVKKLLRKYHVWYYMPVQNGMGVVGIPDIIACLDGHFLAIETKAPGKRKNVTPNQERRLKEIAWAGGTAMVVDDPEQVEKMLRDYKIKD